MRTRLFTSLIAILISLGAIAQGGSKLNIFSEGGEPFYLLLNGIRQNAEPASNLVVENLDQAVYKAKVIFADPNLGEVDKNMLGVRDPETNQAMSVTYQVKKTKKGDYKIKIFSWQDLNQQFAGSSNQVTTTYNTQPMGEIGTGTGSVSVNGNTTGTTVNTTTSGGNSSGTMDVSVNGTGVPNSSVNVNTQGGAGTGTGTGDANGSVDVNVGGSIGVNIDMNVSGTMTGEGSWEESSSTWEETSTSTTTVNGTTTSTTVTTSGTGSTGGMNTNTNIGTGTATNINANTNTGNAQCFFPMDDTDFETALESIKDQDFSDDMITVSRQVIRGNCLSTNQIIQICELMDFEDDRLTIAKEAYAKCTDRNNYYLVNDVFTFSDSIEELEQFITN